MHLLEVYVIHLKTYYMCNLHTHYFLYIFDVSAPFPIGANLLCVFRNYMGSKVPI